jgi:superoxide dismutase, Fe-Mn family
MNGGTRIRSNQPRLIRTVAGYIPLMTEPYVLSDLPYGYEAFEPWCSAETMHLHHDKHHRSYVDAANEAATELISVDPNDARSMAALQSALTFNVGGHLLHTLFWNSLTPEGSGESDPSDLLQRQVEADFGDYDRLRAMLSTACKNVQGTGWGALYFDPIARVVRVGSILDHQHDHLPHASLLAVIDVWEHAYYLGYRNDRPGWVKAAIDHLDWAAIGRRLEDAAVGVSAA